MVGPFAVRQGNVTPCVLSAVSLPLEAAPILAPHQECFHHFRSMEIAAVIVEFWSQKLKPLRS